jgi:hypothetical protein
MSNEINYISILYSHLKLPFFSPIKIIKKNPTWAIFYQYLKVLKFSFFGNLYIAIGQLVLVALEYFIHIIV